MGKLTRHTRLVAVPVLAVVVLGVLVTGCGAAGGRAGSIQDYVAIGDSYAAGPGIPPVVDAGCQRSGANYASLIAKALKVVHFRDASCGGATTDDVWSNQTDSQTGQSVNDAQLDSVHDNTDLVTIGIGSNDQKLSLALAYICLPEVKAAALCQQYLAEPESTITDILTQIFASVSKVISSVRAQAPNARILVIGYPRVLPDTGSCHARFPLPAAAADRLRAASARLDSGFRRVATSAHVQYLDLYAASAGHDICSKDPWVNGVAVADASGRGAGLHPRPAFMRAVYTMVMDRLARDGVRSAG